MATHNARPLLLELFSCEGIGARGYIATGFDVIGVDIEPRMARYYPGRFVAGDWREALRWFGPIADAIHASPPCQGYTIATAGNPDARAKYPRLIPDVREALTALGKPFVIENVSQARTEMVNPVTLCGTHFNLTATDDDGETLELRRHRLFEAHGFTLTSPGPCRHSGGQVAGVYGGARSNKVEARTIRKGGYVPASKAVKAALIGVPEDAHTVKGLYECIPPAYTRHVGLCLMKSLLDNIEERNCACGHTLPDHAYGECFGWIPGLGDECACEHYRPEGEGKP